MRSAASDRLAASADAARGLELTARAVVEGLRAGRHVALRPGEADEFYDYQRCAPGDPVSRVDWRATARRDEPVIRRRRHLAPLTLVVALDASASMGFRGIDPGARAPSKLDEARAIAAALIAVALRQGDAAQILAAHGDGVLGTGIFRGRGALGRACAAIASLTPAGSFGLVAALERVARDASASDVVIAVGDGLEPVEMLAAALGRARKRTAPARDIALVQTLAEDEFAPPPIRAALVDPETRATSATPNADAAAGAAAQVARHVERVRRVTQRLGGRHELHRVGAPIVDSLRRLLTDPARSRGG